MRPLPIIRERIKSLRTNQKKLAAEIGISQSYLSRIICGAQPPSSRVATRLVAVIGKPLSLEYIFSEEPPPTTPRSTKRQHVSRGA